MEFLSIKDEARALSQREVDLDTEPLAALESAAEQVGKSWSQSSLGYQANVYYADFRVPPTEARFSREWGFQGSFHCTTGDWRPYSYDDVVAHVENLAGNPDLGTLRATSDAVREPVDRLIQRARSAAARVSLPHDSYVAANIEELQHISLPRVEEIANSFRNVVSGQFAIRDTQALEGGWQIAGHQAVMAEAMHVRSPFRTAHRLKAVP